MVKETNKIGVRLVFAWIFSVLFILSGLGLFASSVLSGVLMLVAGVLVLPPFTKILKEKANLELSTWLKVIIVLVLLVIAGINIPSDTGYVQNEASDFGSIPSGNDDQVQENSNQPTVHNLGERFEFGEFAYTFHGVDTESEIGSEAFGEFYGDKASGIFLVVDMTVENIGTETTSFFNSAVQIVDDQGRTFDTDDDAWIWLDEDVQFIYEQMQPGLPKRGKIVFDIPQDINGQIRISKGIFSSEYSYVSWN